MENKHNKRRKRAFGAVDGMLSGGVQPKSPGKKHKDGFGGQQVHSNQAVKRARLDDFNVKDGFHPAKQPDVVAHRSQSTGQSVKSGRNPRRLPSGAIDLSLDEGAKKPKKRWYKRLWHSPKRKYFIVPTIIVLIFGFVVIKGIWRWNQVFRGGGGAAALEEGVDPDKLRGEGDGRVNVLLLGKGGPGHEAPDLTDTILVASIDPINNKAALLSIPRDLWVQPEGQGYTKINAVYANAKNFAIYEGKNADEAEDSGLSAIENVVSDKMGIPIHYHAVVDFTAFKQAVDTVGGVDISVGENNTVYEVLWDL